MKQLKLMLLMAFFTLGFSAISFGQIYSTPNVVTRDKCLTGYSGCYKGKVTLKLANTFFSNSSTTNEFPANQTGPVSKNYSTNYEQITVIVGGLTSTGNYYLPKAIGEQIIITSGLDNGHSHAYTVGITKTANQQYTIAVGDYAY
jgi:hypothetical protein